MNVRKIKRAVNSALNVIKSKNIITIKETIEENKILNNKIVFITGGSGGIGKAITKKMLESGAKVIISGTNENKLKQIIKEFNNDNLKYIILNLNEIAKFDEKISMINSIHGKIDILINCAGIHSNKSLNDFFDINEEEYDNIMAINLKGVYFLSQKISKYMIKNKIHGHILNISSSTENEPAWSPYRLSKWGIKGLTQGLAQQLLPYNIIVNSIAPGSTATEMLGIKAGGGDSISTIDNKIGRMVCPEEIAEFVKLLVSDYGDMIVGDTLYISGGRGKIDIR